MTIKKYIAEGINKNKTRIIETNSIGLVKKSKKDISELEANRRDEVAAIAHYEDAKERTDDPGTAALMDHIQEEEEGHRDELDDAIESNKENGETLVEMEFDKSKVEPNFDSPEFNAGYMEVKLNNEQKNKPVDIEYIGKDRWGRETFKDLKTSEIYKKVDGVLNTVTQEGEPIHALHQEMRFVNSVKRMPHMRKMKVLDPNEESMETVREATRKFLGKKTDLDVAYDEVKKLWDSGITDEEELLSTLEENFPENPKNYEAFESFMNNKVADMIDNEIDRRREEGHADFDKSKKGEKQKQHTRISKKGKPFFAGEGAGKTPLMKPVRAKGIEEAKKQMREKMIGKEILYVWDGGPTGEELFSDYLNDLENHSWIIPTPIDIIEVDNENEEIGEDGKRVIVEEVEDTTFIDLWETVDQNKDKFIEELNKIGLYDKFKDESIKKIYKTDDSWNIFYKDELDLLTSEIEKRNRFGNWHIEGENIGWRNRKGSKDVVAKTGGELIDSIAPNSDFSFEVRDFGGKGLYIKLFHHDSPTGEDYYITPNKNIKTKIDSQNETIEELETTIKNMHNSGANDLKIAAGLTNNETLRKEILKIKYSSGDFKYNALDYIKDVLSDKEKSLNKAYTKFPKYLRKEGTRYIYSEKDSQIKSIKKTLTEVNKLNTQYKEAVSLIEKVKDKRQVLLSKIKPIFDAMETEEIETNKSIFEVKEMTKETVSWKELYVEAFKKLDKKMQKQMNRLKTLTTNYSEWLSGKYIKKASDSNLTDLEKQIISCLNEILKNKKELTKISKQLIHREVVKSMPKRLYSDQSISNRTELEEEEEEDNEESEDLEKSKKEHRKHTPIVSRAQQKFFGAELGRAKEEKKTKSGMSKKIIESHLEESKGKFKGKSIIKFPIEKSRTQGAKDKQKRKQRTLDDLKVKEDKLQRYLADIDEGYRSTSKENYKQKEKELNSIGEKIIAIKNKKPTFYAQSEEEAEFYKNHPELDLPLTSKSMSTSSGKGGDVTTIGMGSYPKVDKKRKKQKLNKNVVLPYERSLKVDLLKAIKNRDTKLIKSLKEEINKSSLIGKPYSQQPGRKRGEGTGHIVEDKNLILSFKKLQSENSKKPTEEGLKRMDMIGLELFKRGYEIVVDDNGKIEIIEIKK